MARQHSGGEIKIDNNGMVVSWKTVFAMLVALLGGGSGGLAMFELGTESKVDQKLQQIKDVESTRHQSVSEKLDEHALILESHNKSIDKIDQGVDEIKLVQHKAVSRDEARRLTVDLEPRVIRERNYDRLVDINLRRLRAGRDPCSNLECSN